MAKKPKRTAEEISRLRRFDLMLRSFKAVQIRINSVTINRAIKKDRGNISAILKSHIDHTAVQQELRHYFRTTSPQIWKAALKQVWLDAGTASINFHHSIFTNKNTLYDDELDIEQKDFFDESGDIDEWAPLPEFDFFTKADDIPTDSWAQSVDDYLRSNGSGRAEGISSVTGDQVMSAIADGVAAKEGTADIAARVESQLDDTWAGRAATITRTEVGAATNQASLEDARATVPGMQKVWLCSFVNSREWHQEADQQTVDLDEPFDVMEEELDCPCDPSGSPENVINCMCSLAYVNPSEEGAEGAAPELDEEQTTALADMFDQLASGEGELSSEEAAAMAGGIDEVVGGEAAEAGAPEVAAAPETFNTWEEASRGLDDYLRSDADLIDARENAINRWISSDWDVYNGVLRDAKDVSPETLRLLADETEYAKVSERVNVLADITNNAPQYKGETWRGIRALTTAERDSYANLIEGQIIEDKGFMAMSTDEQFARDWAYDEIVIHIKDAQGVAIGETHQYEILGKPGTQLKILGKLISPAGNISIEAQMI